MTITRAAAGLLALWLALAAGAGQGATLRSGVFDPPRPAPNFTLPASTGTEFTLGSQRGKVVVLAFGFTNCPNICPMTLSVLAQVREQLGALADEVQVVFVTVDPERDTTAALRDYLALFDETFIGISGTPEQLSAVREPYGIVTMRVDTADGGYLVHHASYVYLIDRAGLLRALAPFGATAGDIAHDVGILLQEPVAAGREK